MIKLIHIKVTLMNKIHKIKLSPYHKIFYNEWQLNQLSSKYNIVFDQTISNTLDILRLRNALERLIADHFILNSHITIIDGEPHWITNSTIRNLDVFNGVATYEQIYAYVSQPFNMIEGPLYRFAIFNQADGNYRFVLVWHHLLSDGCAFDELISEISLYYNGSSYKCKFDLSQQIKLISSITDKFDKQLKLAESENKQFWKNSLSDLEPLDLRFIKSSSSVVSESTAISIKELNFYFEADIVSKINQLKDKYGLSIYSYGQIIFAILLHKYTSQNKFGLCYPVEIKEFSGLLFGASINTNIFPFAIDKNTKILDLITHSKNFVNNVRNNTFNHRYLPINEIIAESDKGLLDVFFIQTNLKDTRFDFDNVNVIKINNDFNIDLPSKLLFEQEIKYQLLNYGVRYNVTEVDEAMLTQFVNHYQKLFLDVLFDLEQSNSDKCISEYQILTTEEYNKIVYEWNKTERSYSTNKIIPQLFEEQVEKTPDNIAIIYEEVKLTYNELNQRANQLAHYLRKSYQIQGDELCVLCLERSEYMLIAILGVLKAGGAYVPIDPGYPKDRISYILEDTQAKVVLTNKMYEDRLTNIHINSVNPTAMIKILAIDNPALQSKINQELVGNLVVSITSQNLAYVIYTSGTTGKPKGVMIEHRGVVSLVKNIGYVIVSTEDSIMQLADMAFDAATFEIYTALLNGAKLFIPNHKIDLTADVKKMQNYIIDNKISILWLTTTLFEQLYIQLEDIFSSLTYLLVGGEALRYKIVNKLANSVYKPKNFINGYGPTENTTFSCSYNIINDKLLTLATVPIGMPLNNRFAYILDIYNQPLPLGAVGELYVGGAGLARGYLNLPELTSERFIANPFQSGTEKLQGKNSRLYKTGDLVRYLSDGNIEYIGRNDCQVKIRGYRIELSEVEHTIIGYAGIKQAVVLYEKNLKNSHINGLIAYYVAAEKLDNEEIINYLSDQLPQYMIPKIFIHITQIPLTINGKLDKSALPSPSFEQEVNDYIASRNEVEQIICKSFSDIFSISLSQISVNSDFFKLGGDSLLVISLVIQLQQHSLMIGADEIFKLRTPANIALNVKYHKDYLSKQFHNIKAMHYKMENLAKKDILAMSKKKEAYLQSIKQLKFEQILKPITNVLLTGATGHLGCNILHQLLITTSYKIILLVRASSNEQAYNRLKAKFTYYFDENINAYQSRIQVLASDLSKDNLDLDGATYTDLSQTIDSIIHSAALVSHYGDHDVFYQTNVQATINLLELSKLTQLKDFHYISTISVLIDGYIPECSYYSYVEDEGFNDKLVRGNNIYCQTKLDGEMSVIKYREHGVKSNIYRVGNLAINSQSYKTQENFENNAFFLRAKTVLNLGIIPQDLASVEISPVDCTALAIVKIFQQEHLSNKIYHVFNPNLANLYKFFTEYEHINLRLLPFNDFIDTIMARLQLKTANADNNKLLELFILHQGFLRTVRDTNNITKIEVLQDRTEAILSQLNFKWPHISSNMLSEIINKSF